MCGLNLVHSHTTGLQRLFAPRNDLVFWGVPAKIADFVQMLEQIISDREDDLKEMQTKTDEKLNKANTELKEM